MRSLEKRDESYQIIDSRGARIILVAKGNLVEALTQMLLDLFEQGMSLAGKCRSRLERVEQRVSKLLETGTTEEMDVETS